MFRSGLRTFVRCNSSWKIALTSDGSTVVALHPEQGVPYEKTLPMPEIKVEEKNANSPLKATLGDAMEFLKPLSKTNARNELTRLTLTTKHPWFPRKRDGKAKKTPMEREYL